MKDDKCIEHKYDIGDNVFSINDNVFGEFRISIVNVVRRKYNSKVQNRISYVLTPNYGAYNCIEIEKFEEEVFRDKKEFTDQILNDMKEL